MRKLSLKLVLFTAFAVSIIFYWCNVFHWSNETIIKRKVKIQSQMFKNALLYKTDPIIISFVACERRLNQSLNLVKSIIILTKSPVHFIIFTDDILWSSYEKTLIYWQTLAPHGFKFELKKISFPESHKEQWLNLFHKCAAQRLFIPDLLVNVNKILYVDIDTLFLGPVEELWDKFYEFNMTQFSALVIENENPSISWYPKFAQHPFYGEYGLNSGMMLMDLQKMRDFGWVNYLAPIMMKWEQFIPWGDQDIINIIFHYHSELVHTVSCKYNYRADHCMYGDACEDATKNGVFLIHGSRGVFHDKNQPVFKALYQAIDEYQLGVNTVKDLIVKIKEYVTNAPEFNCSILKKILNIQIAYLKEIAGLT